MYWLMYQSILSLYQLRHQSSIDQVMSEYQSSIGRYISRQLADISTGVGYTILDPISLYIGLMDWRTKTTGLGI